MEGPLSQYILEHFDLNQTMMYNISISLTDSSAKLKIDWKSDRRADPQAALFPPEDAIALKRCSAD